MMRNVNCPQLEGGGGGGGADKSVSLKKYFSYFSIIPNVVGTQKNSLDETILLSTRSTCPNKWIRKKMT